MSTNQTGRFVRVLLPHLYGLGLTHGTIPLRVDADGYLCADGDDAEGRFVAQPALSRILLTPRGSDLFTEPPGVYRIVTEALPPLPDEPLPDEPLPGSPEEGEAADAGGDSAADGDAAVEPAEPAEHDVAPEPDTATSSPDAGPKGSRRRQRTD